MTYVLENEYCRLECMEAGGQMEHLIDKTNQIEILYQGDEGWAGRNPTLFPIVGNTYNGKYEIDGKEYHMKNHGLIRYATLKGKQENNLIVFTYDSNEETRQQYPFDFHYEIQYTLDKKSVHIQYKIENTGMVDMPFSFGLHPAFRLPQKENEEFEEYRLVFEKHEKAKQLVFDETFKRPSKLVDVEMDDWQVSRKDIDTYKTLVFTHLSSDSVTLAYKDEPRIQIDFKGFPYLALWSHPKHSHFLCIEPWYGHADYDTNVPDFYHREGTMILKPGKVFTPFYDITIK